MSEKTLSVFVLFDGAVSREAAVQFCDGLVGGVWTEASLDVDWAPVEDLESNNLAEKHAQKAAGADLLVVSLEPAGNLSLEIRAWMETWLAKRHQHEGALIGLGDPAGFGGAPSEQFRYLRQLAHRGGLDYLTQAPSQLTAQSAGKESQSSITERAAQVGSVMGNILRQRVTPPPLT